MQRTLKACKNPVWTDFAHTTIACEAVFVELGNAPLPFHVMASDPEAHARDLWKRLNAGEFGAIGVYTAAPEKTRSGVAVSGNVVDP